MIGEGGRGPEQLQVRLGRAEVELALGKCCHKGVELGASILDRASSIELVVHPLDPVGLRICTIDIQQSAMMSMQ